jgi:hypothetical protein
MRSFENKIDGGLQYHVLQVDEDTVRKVPKNEDEMVETIKSWESRQESIERLVAKGVTRREKAVGRMKKDSIPIKELFAVEKIDNREVYQRKLVLFKDSDREFRKKVNDYIDLLHRLWRHGIGDTVYNFTINNGYRKDKLFQMDFGEIVFDKRKVKNAVEEKRWKNKWSFSTDIMEEKRELFEQKMNERVTMEKLESIWNKQGNEKLEK